MNSSSKWPRWFEWVEGGFSNQTLDFSVVPKNRDLPPAFPKEKSENVELRLDQRLDALILLTCFVATFASIGLHLMRIGQCQRKNVSSVLMRMFLQLCIVPALFWAVGYTLVNGEGYHGFIGFSGFVPSFNVDDFQRWGLQCALLMYCRSITSCSAQESNYIHVDVISSLLTGLLLFPAPAFWCWNPDGWIRQKGLQAEGATWPVFFVVTGASICLLLFGEKRLKLQLRAYVINERYADANLHTVESVIDQGKEKQIVDSGHSVTLFGIGAILHIVGAVACQVAAGLVTANDSPVDFLPRIVINVVVSASASGLTVCFLSRLLTHQWSNCKIHNGMISGVVAIACGPRLLKHWHCAILGLLSGLVFLPSRNLFIKLQLEDSLDVLSTYGTSAFLSLTFVPIILNWDSDEWLMSFAWGIVGGVAILAWSFLLSLLVFYPLHLFKLFKQRSMFQKEGGLDRHAMREQAFSSPCCGGLKSVGTVDANVLRPTVNENLEGSVAPAAKRFMSRPKYTVSNPRLISTTSDIQAYNLRPEDHRSLRILGEHKDSAGGDAGQGIRSKSFATFINPDAALKPPQSVSSTSVLDRPLSEPAGRKESSAVEPRVVSLDKPTKVRLSLTNSALQDRLLSLKHPVDKTRSVRRNLMSAMDQNNNVGQ